MKIIALCSAAISANRPATYSCFNFHPTMSGMVMTIPTFASTRPAWTLHAGREIRAGRAKWEIGIVTTFDAMGP